MEASFGAFVRDLRKNCHLTLRQVEARVHVSSGYLSQIEQGERGVPHLKILTKLAEAYHVPVTLLLNAAAKDTPEPSGSAGRPTLAARLIALIEDGDEDDQDLSMHAYVHEHLQQGYARLTSENKQRLIDYLDLLLYKQEHAAKHT